MLTALPPRRRSRLVTLTAAAAVGLGLVVVGPVVGGSAEEPKAVKSEVQDIALGDSDAPAKGVVVRKHGGAEVNATPKVSTKAEKAVDEPTSLPPTSEPPAPATATPAADPTASDPAQSSAATPSSEVAPPTSEVAPPTSEVAPPTSEAAQSSEAASPADTSPAAPAATATTLTLSKPSIADFSSIGVTWGAATDADSAVVKARTKSTATGAWSEWNVLEINPDNAPNPSAAGTERDGTDPFWFGSSDGVEVTVDLPAGASMDDLKLTLIDPQKVTQDANPSSASGPSDQAGAALAQPTVYTRAQWGADETQRHWDPQYASTIKAATIHHSADSNNYSQADVPGIMRSIYRYQAVTRGWGDIGYNVIIDKWGRMWEGRYGGLASTVIGAHAGGFNTYTFGVSMLGNYDVTPVPAAVTEAAAQIIAWKFKLYGVNPASTTTLVQRSGAGTTAKFNDGQAVAVNAIFGHRDVGSTVCPGRYGYAMLPQLRARVAQISAVRTQAYLRNSNTSGLSEIKISRGMPGDQIVACDWDGDGKTTLAYFRRGGWYLFNRNPPEANVQANFIFGQSGDIPICGDWDGDGKESIGIYRSAQAKFYLRNTNSSGLSNASYTLGSPGGTPIVGDWNGDKKDIGGVYQGAAFIRVNSTTSGAAKTTLAMGNPGDQPVAGDFNGNGRDTVGVMRGRTFYLSNLPGSAVATVTIGYGSAPQQAMFGDWDGNKTDTLGVIQ